MKRRRFLFGLTATSAVLWAGASMAATYADGVVGQLTKQGFYDIAVETTWLGRLRIVANRADGQREIILNPRTGEILRDSWQASGAGRATPIIDEVNGGAASSEGSSDGGGPGSGSGQGQDNSGSDGSGGNDHGGADDGGTHDGSHSGDQGGSDGGGGDHGGNSGHGGSDNSHGGGGDGGKDDEKGGKGD